MPNEHIKQSHIGPSVISMMVRLWADSGPRLHAGWVPWLFNNSNPGTYCRLKAACGWDDAWVNHVRKWHICHKRRPKIKRCAHEVFNFIRWSCSNSFYNNLEDETRNLAALEEAFAHTSRLWKRFLSVIGQLSTLRSESCCYSCFLFFFIFS